jgi:hypothetical protein
MSKNRNAFDVFPHRKILAVYTSSAIADDGLTPKQLRAYYSKTAKLNPTRENKVRESLYRSAELPTPPLHFHGDSAFCLKRIGDTYYVHQIDNTPSDAPKAVVCAHLIRDKWLNNLATRLMRRGGASSKPETRQLTGATRSGVQDG